MPSSPSIVNAVISSAASPNVDGVTDLSGFSSVHVQIVGPYVGVLVPQFSNDGVNWSTAYWQSSLASAGGFTNQLTATGTNSLYSVPVRGRFFRILNSAYTSGTAFITILYTSSVLAASNGSVSLLSSSVGANAALVSGSIAALNATVDGTTDLQNYSNVKVQVTGTWVGTLTFEASIDGTNWVTQNLAAATAAMGTTTSSNNILSADLKGRYFRVKAAAYTSGTAAVTILYSAAAPGITAPALSNGINNIGFVGIGSGSGRSPQNFNRVSTADTNAVLVISSGRWLQELTLSNPTNTPAYFKLYNIATVPVVGTDIPRVIIPIPANSTIVTDWGPNGKVMTAGVAYALTGGMGATDTTAAPAGVLIDGSLV